MFEEDRASILHADIDSFYASVEQRDDPKLRGRPVLVGGGVVLAASYEAKAFGVSGGMGGALARRLCPRALVVAPRFAAYTEASRAVFAIFEDTTPLVEGVSIDEAFLDVGGLRRLVGTPVQIAAELRRRILTEVGLPITVGVARTKFLAKVASRVAKPDGLLRVDPDRELEFLHPLPVLALWGVGPVTADKLAGIGIRTVGEVAQIPAADLAAMVGKAAARTLHDLAHNRDPRPVVIGRRRRSIGSQSAIGPGPHTAGDVDAVLLAIVDRVTRRLRAADRIGRTVVLRVRFGDYTAVTRSHTLATATAATTTVHEAATALLAGLRADIDIRGVTLVGLAVAELADAGTEQFTLPFGRASHSAPVASGSLDCARDAVRDRFGTDALTTAVLLGRRTGFEVPKLPD